MKRFNLTILICSSLLTVLPCISIKAQTEININDTAETAIRQLPWKEYVKTQIDSLLAKSMFQTSQVGMMVFDLDADSVIYAHNERQLMRPASTLKVITAITAIDKLGGSFRFKTDLCYTGNIENNTLNGEVYCVGGFDPRFNNDDMRAFAESIHKMGVDTIRGKIIADTSMKDTNLLGEGWCWDDENPTLTPLLINRKDIFMDRFREALMECGIVIDAVQSVGCAPEDAHVICCRTHTIDQILMRMLKDSDNLYAESLFFQIAAASGVRPANSDNAKNSIFQLIRKIGLNPSSYNIADGSGLSLYNYLSAELEISMLKYAYHRNNIYIHLYPSLPVAGCDGTLSNRMRDTFTYGNVHAKTGTVFGVSSLAGYCKAANGHMLCFCIINQGLMHGSNGRRFQDRICEILCRPQYISLNEKE